LEEADSVKQMKEKNSNYPLALNDNKRHEN